jgi:stearoyl-CoA desaturase (delta-9 desaturase)
MRWVRRKSHSWFETWGAVTFLVALHTIPVVAICRGTTLRDWIALVPFYLWGAFNMGVVLHRFFAHRAFSTSRTFQFLLGLSACTIFTDAIGFSGKHRLHHRYSDTEEDVHSPLHGWWACWVGHFFDEGHTRGKVHALAADLHQYWELRWLRRFYLLPGAALGAVTWYLGGFGTFAIGFCLSRVLVIHMSSSVNYFCHRFGNRRYATRDQSTNNSLVALLTFGEGWHNNHHHYPSAASAGFFWWELDVFYWIIRLLAAAGLIWKVREVPKVARYSGTLDAPVAEKW